MSFVTHDQNELVWFTSPLLDGVRHGFSTRQGIPQLAHTFRKRYFPRQSASR